jgi:L-fuconolactonase
VIAWAERRGHDVDAIMWRNAAEFYRVGQRPAVPADEPRPRRGGFLGWLRGE